MYSKKSIEIAQSYIGKLPQEYSLVTWTELKNKMAKEMQEASIIENSKQGSQVALGSVKKYLREQFDDGCECPACGQYVKQYRRRIGSPQCRGLILLYSIHNNLQKEWVHIRDIIKEVNVHGDFAKMLYWELIEEKPNDNNEKKNSGLWKITNKGKSFVRNEIKIPSHAFVYNGKCNGMSESTTDIVESLGKKFNYNNLMKR